jgi:hypothetical protein
MRAEVGSEGKCAMVERFIEGAERGREVLRELVYAVLAQFTFIHFRRFGCLSLTHSLTLSRSLSLSFYLLAVLVHCSNDQYSSTSLTNSIIPNTTTTTRTTTTRTTTTRTTTTRTTTLPVVSPPSYPGTGLDRSRYKSSRHTSHLNTTPTPTTHHNHDPRKACRGRILCAQADSSAVGHHTGIVLLGYRLRNPQHVWLRPQPKRIQAVEGRADGIHGGSAGAQHGLACVRGGAGSKRSERKGSEVLMCEGGRGCCKMECGMGLFGVIMHGVKCL